MAVPQQLARIPAAQLAACRRSVEVLDDLCSFKSAPAVLGKAALEMAGDLDELAQQHAITRDFYEAAARRGLAVVLWWD
jgi:hypothetical protein